MATVESPKSKHIWKFFRAGGLYQVKFDSGADLLALDKLDQKLWVALSCPTRGLEFDSKTLDLIDSDKDGRIRASEMLTAVRWTTTHIKNPDELFKSGDVMPLTSINDQIESGKRLLSAARLVLSNLGKPEATSISLADFSDPARIYAQSQFNGDGVISPDSILDPEVKQVTLEILEILGGTADRSGVLGVTQAKLDQFFKELQSYADWWQKAQQPLDGPPVLIFGADTLPAWETLKAVRAKINDYFARCRVAAFDLRATLPLNRAEAEFVAMAPKSFANYCEEVLNLPLARVEGHRPLPLVEGVNPAWTKAVEDFRSKVIAPAYGSDKTTLTELEWSDLLHRFAPCDAWMAAKQGIVIEKLGLPRVQQILAGKSRDVLSKMIAQDLAVAPAMAEISNVEKLIRYRRDLCSLLNNFVSFSDFYARDRKAIFQAGTLYMDGRSCHLCIKITDAASHATLANLGRTYLAYCDLRRPATNEKMTIAAAFTGGDSDQLRPGRNGIFYDRQGRDWDATVISVVEHPISIHQAFWSPYKRIGKMINEQIERLASARDKAVMEKAEGSLENTVKTVKAAETGKVERPKIDTGTLAAIGMIMTGLVGALSTVLGAFVGLASTKDAWWKLPLVIVGLIMAISGPSMIIAWLKLRTRDLGPILDASGWAINGRIKLNMALGRILTELAIVPGTAIRSLEDLYPDDPPKVPKWAWVLFSIAIAGMLLEFTGALGYLGFDGLIQKLFLRIFWPLSGPMV